MRISDWSSDVCSSDLIVAFTFPHLFTKRELKFANAELLNSYPDPWERLTGQKILPGQSRSRDEQAFLTENANRLIVGSAINRSEEHTSEIQPLMRISYAVFCMTQTHQNQIQTQHD